MTPEQIEAEIEAEYELPREAWSFAIWLEGRRWRGLKTVFVLEGGHDGWLDRLASKFRPYHSSCVPCKEFYEALKIGEVDECMRSNLRMHRDKRNRPAEGYLSGGQPACWTCIDWIEN